MKAYVDGPSLGTAEWGHCRPDVGEVHPGDEHSFCGFFYALDTRPLPNGNHTLSVKVTDDSAQSSHLASCSVDVRN